MENYSKNLTTQQIDEALEYYNALYSQLDDLFAIGTPPNTDYSSVHNQLKQVDTAIEALELAREVQWQTIETAPKDGSSFFATTTGVCELIWNTIEGGEAVQRDCEVDYKEPILCFYNSESKTFMNLLDGNEFTEKGSYIAYDADREECDEFDEHYLRLTYWQPLPTPPKEQADEHKA